jgi:hypothetical protein
MGGQKVICIDAGDRRLCDYYGIVPLIEGEIYTVRKEVIAPKGQGYLLEEIINNVPVHHNGVLLPGIEVAYLTSRFIPLSTIDETERIINYCDAN